MASRITRVKLRDYRSIARCDVELQPFTVLVGPNGAGKSNFLDCLRFLKESGITGIEKALRDRSGIQSVLRKLPAGKSASCFSIEVSLEPLS
jgi:predicted ATPase